MTPEDVDRILSWPRGTRSDAENDRLSEYRAGVHREMRGLVDTAEHADRGFDADEAQRYDELLAEYDRLGSEVLSRPVVTPIPIGGQSP